ncbi:hypothetical protein C8R45DRAFT_1107278 [Mycena sanguinolenta]|nr:hypothetical protein C8R45DRAFT_1107278 [Mycena sanguinolenta]
MYFCVATFQTESNVNSIFLLAYSVPVAFAPAVVIIPLKRRKNTGLKCLGTNLIFSPDDPDTLSKVIPLIASNLARLEHLKLAVFLDDLRTIQDSMPVLRHLDLRLLRYPGFDIRPVSLGELPLLRSVVLNFVAPQNVRLPWAQLTSLAMHEVDLEDAIPILAQTSNLIHCELHVRDTVLDFGRVVTVPSLESLVLKARNNHLALHSYLTFFITPALCCLIISERILGFEPLRSLTDFISKSGGNLQEVRITGRRLVSTTSYREALQSVPRLCFSREY